MESITVENMKEVFGCLHHQVSQQQKEIGMINMRLSQLINEGTIQFENSTITAFIEASNKRLESFGATIQSLSDELILHEQRTQRSLDLIMQQVKESIVNNQKIIEERLDKLESKTENSACFTEIFDLKIEDAVKSHMQTSSPPLKKRAQSSMKKRRQPLPLTTSNSKCSNILIVDIKPISQIKRQQEETNRMLSKRIAELGDELKSIRSQIKETSSQSCLQPLFRLPKPNELLPQNNPSPRKSMHVQYTLISGENLKRPKTGSNYRPRGKLEKPI